MNKNPFLNDSCCPDPTAYEALKPIIKQDNNLDKKVHNLINVLKFIIEWAGFELIGRIKIRDKKSGKEFK